MRNKKAPKHVRGNQRGHALSLPVMMTLIVGASVFSVELCIMIFLPGFHLSASVDTIIDSTTLLLIVAPILYAFILRPLTDEISARTEAEQSLRALNEDLETRISARTRELTEALAKVEKGMIAKDLFCATMSHEIRTPLNAVVGMTQLLLNSALSPEQEELARMAGIGAQLLQNVVDDILDFTKLEAGKIELEAADFNPQQCLEECAGLAAGRAQENGLELIVAAAPDLPRALRGDERRLRQIVLNLLNNAVKFTERGEVVLRAKAVARSDRGVTVRFEVQDTGIGIAPEDRPKLFQAFVQVDVSTTRRFGGTGLGLAISRRLIEIMGGRIGFDSDLGIGSTFWFEVPFEPAEAAAETAAPVGLSGLKVLVVDDNATSRGALKLRLEAWGMRCGALADGGPALEELRSAAAAGSPYRAAILDLQMPGLDGLAVARAIRGDRGLDAVALILMTPLRLAELGVEARPDGISAYLTKPLRQSALLSALADTAGGGAPDSGQAARTDSAPRIRESERVLVVEDNSLNQVLTSRQLKKLGFPSDVAGNGRDALKLLASRRYALILMDCHMPEMDGFEAAAVIRRMEPPLSRIPIIAMTADVLSGDREKCLAAGMDDYLSKPVTLESLARAISRWTAARAEADGGRSPDSAVPAGSEAAVLTWKKEYSVQVQTLDEDHKKLFGLINELHAAIRRDKGPEVLGGILEALVDYSRYHFSAEETLMARYGYPGYAPHKSEHEKFILAIRQFQARLVRGEAAITTDVSNFLRNWLSHHVLTMDKKYALFFAGRKIV